MIYRLLENGEKEKLRRIFPAYQDADLSKVIIGGAVENGEVQSFAVLNPAPHCEPWYIAPKSGVDFRRVLAVVEEEAKKLGCKELWLFATDDKQQRMAEIAGAKEMGWKVMRKELV